MLPKRGLLRRNGSWFHISSGRLTTIFRQIDGEGATRQFVVPKDGDDQDAFVADAETFSLSEISAKVAPDLKDFPARGYRHEEVEKWREVIECLERDLARLESARSSPPTPQTGQPGPIPVTRLRRFYESLRMLNTRGLHTAIAAHLSGGDSRAGLIDALFEESLVHMGRYWNVEQPFHPGTRSGWEAYRTRPDQFARCLAAHLAPHGEAGASIAVAGDPALEYSTVDYEVSPLRTAGGHKFEDGRPGRSSGGGGIDLLFVTPDGIPTIGEVKAKGDTSLFLAFIQALTYAAELLTAPQMERLGAAYPTHPWAPNPTPVCELLIFIPEGDAPASYRETVTLIKHLLGKADGAVANHVRRVSVVEAAFLPDDLPRFTLRDSLVHRG